MKVTRKEWKVLERLLANFANDRTKRLDSNRQNKTEDQIIAENLLARFKMELTLQGSK